MSKYQIESFPQDKFSFRIYVNDQKKTWQQIKKETGCCALINLEYYNMKTFKADTALMVGGKWLANPQYYEFGVCINKEGYMTVGTNKNANYDYAVAVPPMYYNGQVYNASYSHNTKDFNGATAVGFKSDGTPVLLICSKDEKMSSYEVCQAMLSYGCNTILRYDGSWSSQGDLGNGKVVAPSETRIVHNYLLVFEKNKGGYKEETKPIVNKKYTVCLDAGHDAKDLGNCSPDKTYYEYKFAWDMVNRVKILLEKQNINVVLSKNTQDEEKSLTDRAKVSNNANADLFISFHSNAAGGSGWSNARGWEVYTSQAGETAKRNIAANCVINQTKAVGMVMRSNPLKHELFTVLTKTYAPAMLIEFGFHTNREDVALLNDNAYRDKLALATAKGVCDYFGIKYVENIPVVVPPSPTVDPNRAKVQARFGFDDNTMNFLETHKYKDALLKKLAEAK